MPMNYAKTGLLLVVLTGISSPWEHLSAANRGW